MYKLCSINKFALPCIACVASGCRWICSFCVYWLGGSIRWEATEKCVRLQLCILVSTLCHVFGWLINLSIFLESGMDAVSPHQTRFSPERLPIIYVAHVVCWTPSRQPAIEGHVITGQIWQGSRENYGIRHCFGKITHDATLILVTSDWRNRVSPSHSGVPVARVLLGATNGASYDRWLRTG